MNRAVFVLLVCTATAAFGNQAEVKPSATAIAVASALPRSVFLGNAPHFSIQEAELAQHLLETARDSLNGINWILVQTLAKMPYSWQSRFCDLAVVANYDGYIMRRKLHIKTNIEAALQRGVKQIVFLGGGYDVRSLMVAQAHPDTRVFEIDRGPTRGWKLQGIRSIPSRLGFGALKIIDEPSGSLTVVGNNLFFIKADLDREPLKDVLTQAGFSPDQDSLIIAEGLTVYLTKEANHELLKSVAEIGSGTHELLAGYMAGVNWTFIQSIVQSSSKENYHFSLAPTDAEAFFKERGFAINNVFSPCGDVNDESCRMREIYYLLSPATIVDGLLVRKRQSCALPELSPET